MTSNCGHLTLLNERFIEEDRRRTSVGMHVALLATLTGPEAKMTLEQ